MIRSPLPLTIRGFCLCQATFKLSLIRAGRSRHRNGGRWSIVLSKGNHCDRLPMGTRVSYEAVRRVLRAAHRR